MFHSILKVFYDTVLALYLLPGLLWIMRTYIWHKRGNVEIEAAQAIFKANRNRVDDCAFAFWLTLFYAAIVAAVWAFMFSLL